MRNEILVLLGVLVVSGCVSQQGSDSGINMSDFNTSSMDENVTTVYYTDSGFIPEEVTVQEGGKVVFIDESSNHDMWVASNDHPVHSNYDSTSLNEHCPGESFDQCSTESKFEFTFGKTGEWSYHNHRLSSHSGRVVVE